MIEQALETASLMLGTDRSRGYCLEMSEQIIGRRTAMSQKIFSLVAGVIFLVIAIMHVLRLVLKWEAIVNGRTMPMWVSWVGVLIAGCLAYEGFRLSQGP